MVLLDASVFSGDRNYDAWIRLTFSTGKWNDPVFRHKRVLEFKITAFPEKFRVERLAELRVFEQPGSAFQQ